MPGKYEEMFSELESVDYLSGNCDGIGTRFLGHRQGHGRKLPHLVHALFRGSGTGAELHVLFRLVVVDSHVSDITQMDRCAIAEKRAGDGVHFWRAD